MTSGWLQRRRGRRSPLYGRGRELALLRDLLDAAAGGDGSLALISGEAGIGKTTLVEALEVRAGQRQFRVLRGDCFDLTTTPPYGPWIEALRGYDAASTGIVAPTLIEQVETVDDPGSQSALLEDALRFFNELAGQRPLLIVLEDLHWSDPASLETLRFVSRRLLAGPVMIVATYRDDEITRSHRLFELLPALVRESQTVRIHLQALDAHALRQVVSERYRLDPDDHARLTSHLFRLSEGNPLYATELLNGLEDAGIIEVDEQSVRLGELSDVVVPPLIRQVIERRIGGLADRERRLLEIGAVIGHEFSVDVWAQVAGEPVQSIISAVEHADALDVLKPDGRIDRVRFRHALIREVLFQAVVPVRRREWHRHIAELLIARPQSDPDEIADHLEKAADDRAAEWLIRAGNRAERSYAWSSAIDRFKRALPKLSESSSYLHVRALLLYRIGRLVRYMDRYAAIEALEESASLARLADETMLEWRARFQLALVRCYDGQLRQGQAEMAAAIDEIQQSVEANTYSGRELCQDGSQSSLLELVSTGTIAGTGPRALKAPDRWAPRATYLLGEAIRGNSHGVREQIPDVIEGLQAREPESRQGSRLPQEIYFAQGLTSAALGYPTEALRYINKAREASESINHHLLACAAASQILRSVILPYFSDRPADRKRYARIGAEHGRLAADAVLGDQVPLGLLKLGWEPLVSGHWDELPDDHDLNPTSFMTQDDLEDAADLRAHLAYHQGNRIEVEQIINRFIVEESEAEPGDSNYIAISSLIRLAARHRLDSDDLSEARVWLEANDRWLAWSGAVLGKAEGTLEWARYRQMSGRIDEARGTARQALDEASDPHQPLTLIAIHRFMGEISTADGLTDEAWQELQASLALARQCEAPYEQALTMLEMAKLHVASDDHEAARRLIARVRAICKPLGAIPALERAAAIERPLAMTDQFVLTQREIEVLRLVARGMTDNEVAEQLYISPRTVGQHLRSIYNKLDVNNRTEAAHIASDRELI